MALRLTIISEQSAGLGDRASMLVEKGGIRIGRAPDNEWVLPDPSRYISAHHARIAYRNGSYIVEDTSTNGLYLNNELEPVGRLGPQPLRSGDTLRMGAYQINVRDNDAPAPEASAIVPYGIPAAGGDPADPQRDIGIDLNISSLLVSDTDQSAAHRAHDSWGNPLTDSALLRYDSVQSRATHAPVAPPPARPAAALPAGAFETFCRGAGLDGRTLPADAHERLLQLGGLLLREMLVGVKELARTQREIRQDAGLCAIADDPERVALQNLPVEELLARLLLSHDQRQLDAVQWLRELFGLASRHDAALMRALRPALLEFTQRLDPALLSPGSPAAERFRSITGMSDGRLPHLFAEALARSFNAEISGARDEV